MLEQRNILQPEGGHRRHRAMAQPLQHDPTALVAALSATRAADIRAGNPPFGSERSDAGVSNPAGPKYPSGHFKHKIHC
jgi:hypothetical protein